MPRLKKELRVPTPADRGSGRPWRPGTAPPAPVDPDLPSADIRIGYTRCSTLGQELDSQLDALSKHGIPRDKISSEKISTRVRARPKFEEALRTAREVKAHSLVHDDLSGHGPHWRLLNRTTVNGAIAGSSFQLPLTLPLGQVTSRRSKSIMKFSRPKPSPALRCRELFSLTGPTSSTR
ncbi:recombinase family protein [Streptomyces sp. NPDC021100]|uniref:recombinase family protein n=1 Tax=Streptomyces sp. NPDC021100 TaxID=3365114 RepID=UPI0037925149